MPLRLSRQEGSACCACSVGEAFYHIKQCNHNTDGSSRSMGQPSYCCIPCHSVMPGASAVSECTVCHVHLPIEAIVQHVTLQEQLRESLKQPPDSTALPPSSSTDGSSEHVLTCKGATNDCILGFPLVDDFLQGPMLVDDRLLEYRTQDTQYTPAAYHTPAWALAGSCQQEGNREWSHSWTLACQCSSRMLQPKPHSSSLATCGV